MNFIVVATVVRGILEVTNIVVDFVGENRVVGFSVVNASVAALAVVTDSVVRTPVVTTVVTGGAVVCALVVE